MKSFSSTLSRNQKRIWRFAIVTICVLVVIYIIFPFLCYVLLRLGLITLPDIGDSDPQALPEPPDSPLEIVFVALLKIILFPAETLESICHKTSIDPRGNVWVLLVISPGLFWAFFVELLIEAKNRLRPNKPQDKIISN